MTNQEVLLIIKAQNEASGALKEIGTDLRGVAAAATELARSSSGLTGVKDTLGGIQGAARAAASAFGTLKEASGFLKGIGQDLKTLGAAATNLARSASAIAGMSTSLKTLEVNGVQAAAAIELLGAASTSALAPMRALRTATNALAGAGVKATAALVGLNAAEGPLQALNASLTKTEAIAAAAAAAMKGLASASRSVSPVRTPRASGAGVASEPTVGAAVAPIGGGLLGGLAFAGAATGIGGVVHEIADFGKAVSALKNTFGPADAETLRQQARTLGSSGQYDATQIAHAQLEVGKAGYDTSAQASQVAPAVLNLASASGASSTQSVELLKTTMDVYNKSAKDAAIVSDALALSATRLGGHVDGLRESMKTIGPVAMQLGVPLNETLAVFDALSRSGVEGTAAATGFKNFFTILETASTSKKAVNVLKAYGLEPDQLDIRKHKLSEILELLSKLDEPAVMRLFGRNGAGAIATMISQRERVGQNEQELDGSKGYAAKAAITGQDNLAGDIQGVATAAKNAVQTLGDSGGTNFLRTIAQDAAGLISVLSGVAEKGSNAKLVFGGMETTAGALYERFNGLASAVVGVTSIALATWFEGAAASAGKLVTTLLTTRTGLLTLGAAAAAGALYEYRDSLIDVGTRQATLGDIVASVWAQSVEGTKLFASYMSTNLVGSVETVWEAFKTLANFEINFFTGMPGLVLAGAKAFADILGNAIDGVLGKVKGLAGSLASLVTGNFSEAGQQAGQVFGTGINLGLGDAGEKIAAATKGMFSKDWVGGIGTSIASGLAGTGAGMVDIVMSDAQRRMAQRGAEAAYKAQQAARALQAASAVPDTKTMTPLMGPPLPVSGAENAAKKEESAFNALIKSIDPLAAHTHELAEAQELLKKRFDEGAITADQYQHYLALANQKYGEGSDELTKFNASIDAQTLALHQSNRERQVEAETLAEVNKLKAAGYLMKDIPVDQIRSKIAGVKQQEADNTFKKSQDEKIQAMADEASRLELVGDAKEKQAGMDAVRREAEKAGISDVEGAVKRYAAAFDALQKAKDIAMADGTLGFRQAMDDYAKRAKDLAADVKKFTADVLSGSEDMFAEFVTTGKANWAGFLKSIEADAARTVFHQAMSFALSATGFDGHGNSPDWAGGNKTSGPTSPAGLAAGFAGLLGAKSGGGGGGDLSSLVSGGGGGGGGGLTSLVSSGGSGSGSGSGGGALISGSTRDVSSALASLTPPPQATADATTAGFTAAFDKIMGPSATSSAGTGTGWAPPGGMSMDDFTRSMTTASVDASSDWQKQLLRQSSSGSGTALPDWAAQSLAATPNGVSDAGAGSLVAAAGHTFNGTIFQMPPGQDMWPASQTLGNNYGGTVPPLSPLPAPTGGAAAGGYGTGGGYFASAEEGSGMLTDDVVVGGGGGGGGFGSAAGAGASPAAAGGSGGLSGMLGDITAMPGKIIGGFTSAISSLLSGITSTISGLLSGLASGVSSLVSGIGGIFGGSGSVMGGLSGSASAANVSSAAADTGGSSSSALSGIGSFIASFFHDGGTVGAPSRTASFSSGVWADAVRYHTGGLAGDTPLKSNEVPAILLRGEQVLTQDQQGKMASLLAQSAANDVGSPTGRAGGQSAANNNSTTHNYNSTINLGGAPDGSQDLFARSASQAARMQMTELQRMGSRN
jgi:TP901 family phage tail tape measure protein/lambda family phage tail tape measure protein